MMAVFLDAEQPAYRHSVRDFLDAHIDSIRQCEQSGQISKETWALFADAGLFKLPFSGSEVWRTSIFLDELGYVGLSGFRSAIGVAAFMAPCYLKAFGSDRMKTDILTRVESGQCILGLAITDPGGGSDLRTVSCIAELKDGSFCVSGEKCYVANGRSADTFITLVRTGKAGQGSDLPYSSFLMISRDTAGLTINPLNMLGWRSADICNLVFDNSQVARSNLIGGLNMALIQLGLSLNFERLVAGTLALGGCRKALDLIISTIKNKGIQGRSLADFQAISHPVAEYASELQMLESYCHKAWLQQAESSVDTLTSAILKVKATELNVKITQDLVRFSGATGYMEQLESSQLYRDAIGATLAAGPSELMRDIIANEVIQKKT